MGELHLERMVSMSKKLIWFLNNIPELAAGICLVTTILFSSANAFSRYVSGKTFAGTDELVALLFAWFLFVGAAVAHKNGKHFGIDLVVGKMPEGVRKVIALLIKIVEMAGIGVLVYLAWVLTEKVGDRKLVALGIPYVYLDLAYLLGMALMFVYSVVGFVKQLLSFRKRETKTEAE